MAGLMQNSILACHSIKNKKKSKYTELPNKMCSFGFGHDIRQLQFKNIQFNAGPIMEPVMLYNLFKQNLNPLKKLYYSLY